MIHKVVCVFVANLENWEYGHRDSSRWPRGTLYQQKLTLTSPRSSFRSVGIVCLWIRATEVFLVYFLWHSQFGCHGNLFTEPFPSNIHLIWLHSSRLSGHVTEFFKMLQTVYQFLYGYYSGICCYRVEELECLQLFTLYFYFSSSVSSLSNCVAQYFRPCATASVQGTLMLQTSSRWREKAQVSAWMHCRFKS
jgi:hypothetical protein